MSMLVVTMLKPCFVDFLFPFEPIITLGPLLVSLAHHPLTRLLVTLSLPFCSQFKALLTRSAILLGKILFLSEVHAIYPQHMLILITGTRIIEAKPFTQHQLCSQLLAYSISSVLFAPFSLTGRED